MEVLCMCVHLCVCVHVFQTTTNLGYCDPNLHIQAARCGVNVSTLCVALYQAFCVCN